MTYEIEYWVGNRDSREVTTVQADSITDALQAVMELKPELKQKPSRIKRCVWLRENHI